MAHVTFSPHYLTILFSPTPGHNSSQIYIFRLYHIFLIMNTVPFLLQSTSRILINLLTTSCSASAFTSSLVTIRISKTKLELTIPDAILVSWIINILEVVECGKVNVMHFLKVTIAMKDSWVLQNKRDVFPFVWSYHAFHMKWLVMWCGTRNFFPHYLTILFSPTPGHNSSLIYIFRLYHIFLIMNAVPFLLQFTSCILIYWPLLVLHQPCVLAID